jgi:solute carrier family 8 (sodium/calcium exchanger)
MKVGVRTIEDSAKNGRDYDNIDQVITMKPNESEATVEVRIHDDDEWNPDNDFYLELYDVNTKRRLFGEDTKCKVTILDEDFPGKLQFKRTEVMGSRKNKKVEVTI